MKFVLACVVLGYIITAVVGGSCKFMEHKFKVGEKYFPPGECVELNCLNENLISPRGCPIHVAKENCKLIPKDPLKEFPQCCERVCGLSMDVVNDTTSS